MIATKDKHIITAEEYVLIVESIWRDSAEYPETDIVARTQRAIENYHSLTKGKWYQYNKNQPIEFDSITTSKLESVVLQILQKNLSGQIAESLELTRSLWNGEMVNSVYDVYPEKAKVYYRTRNCEKADEIKSAKDLFHVPYEKRGLVKSARYSVLGFPSLYLTDNLYTAWEESRRSHIETFYAAKLKLQHPISLFDLRLRRDFTGNEDAVLRQISAYLSTMPLIIACSLKVKNDKDAFKPEYLLPQLLITAIIEEMIQRGQMLRLGGFEMSNSTLELVDEQLDHLLTKVYHGDVANMIQNLRAWANSQNGGVSVSSVASSILCMFAYDKYSHIGNGPSLCDIDWEHYENRKGLKLFAPNGINGIIYSSTRTDHGYWKKARVSSDCTVIPISSLHSDGFCPELCDMFTISRPVGYNADSLRSINGKGSDNKEYEHSYFGLLEGELEKCKYENLGEFGIFLSSASLEEKRQKLETLSHKLDTACQEYDSKAGLERNTATTKMNELLRMILLPCPPETSSLLQMVGVTMMKDSAYVQPKGGMSFWDVDHVSNSYVHISSVNMGLLRKKMRGLDNGEIEFDYTPLLDSNRDIKNIPLTQWLKTPVIQYDDKIITREEIIGYYTNRSGRWYNYDEPKHYKEFSQPYSLRTMVNGKAANFKSNPVYVSLRQIAWEVINTLTNIDF